MNVRRTLTLAAALPLALAASMLATAGPANAGVCTGDPSAPECWTPAPYVDGYINSGYVNIRSGPGTNYSTVAGSPADRWDQVTVDCWAQDKNDPTMRWDRLTDSTRSARVGFVVAGWVRDDFVYTGGDIRWQVARCYV